MRSPAPILNASKAQPSFNRAHPARNQIADEKLDAPSSLDQSSRTGRSVDFGRVPIHSSDGVAVQTKLTINETGDEYEQEADKVADQIIASPPAAEGSSPPPTIRRAAAQSNTKPDTTFPSLSEVLTKPGSTLNAPLQKDMEQRIGRDFSKVRIHADAAADGSARDIGARAFTVGRNIVFRRGAFAPETASGRRLIAHELTHVVQQSANPQTGVAIQREPAPGDDKAARDAAKLAELARDPREAHRAWKSLSPKDKDAVVDKMGRHYGADFAKQFRAVADSGKAPFGLTYWQAGMGPSPEKLKADGWRFLEMEVTGSGGIDIEVWINPLGGTIRRDVSKPAPKETPTKEEAPPEADEFDDVEILRKKFTALNPKLWAAIVDYDQKVQKLESDPQAPDRAEQEAEITKSQNAARNLTTELAHLQDEANDIDDKLTDEIAEEWGKAMEQYTKIMERLNAIP